MRPGEEGRSLADGLRDGNGTGIGKSASSGGLGGAAHDSVAHIRRSNSEPSSLPPTPNPLALSLSMISAHMHDDDDDAGGDIEEW